jgi:hypothetical protein
MDLSKVSYSELRAELYRRDQVHWEENWALLEKQKRGDCAALPGWDTSNCCASCHDPGRTDTRLEEVKILDSKLLVCCHAERWWRTGSWEMER